MNDKKQGGNVASYFCRVVNDELHVIHAIPGPVDARKFLSEARFAVELHNQAMLAGAKSWHKYGVAVQNGFRERIGRFGTPLPLDWQAAGTQQDQVNTYLAKTTLPKLVSFYPVVWERILAERLSSSPVQVR